MKLIHAQDSTDQPWNQSIFVLNQKNYTFCSLFDYNEHAEFVLIFNNLNDSDYIFIADRIKKNANIERSQKILFVGHILFDYQKGLNKLISIIDNTLIYVLVDNKKNPFLISEQDIKLLKDILINVLVYQSHVPLEKNNNQILNLKVIFKVVSFQFLKFFLKPVQFFKDLHSTYNFHYFYGKIRSLFTRAYFEIRHISVMSAIRFFYGIKVFLIRFYFGSLRLAEYSIIKIYYFLRHVLSIFLINFRATLDYLKGCLEWCYYRLEWCYYRLEWCYYRLHEFNLRYTFYPFRKIVWFLTFQYKKRILKKI